MSKYKILMAAVIACIIAAYSIAFCEQELTHEWTNLNGPYWVSGADVACGTHNYDNTVPWYRYLIGGNGNDIRPFYWDHTFEKWNGWNDYDPLPGANKIISYNSDHHGDFAFCTAYGGDAYKTVNGGESWTSLGFGDYFSNNHFNTVEVKFTTANPERTAFVGTAHNGNVPTAYIYHYSGGNPTWDRLGGPSNGGNPDPMFGKDVYDIECNHDGRLFAGTSDGIYYHTGESNYHDNWTQQAFEDHEVLAIEDVNCREIGDQQLAEVTYSATPPVSHKLWYSPEGDHFRSPIEITPDNSSFDHEVYDLAAIRCNEDLNNTQYISCYAATSDGLYLIHFKYNESGLSALEKYDIKEIQTVDGFYPMQYDQQITGVDYTWETSANIITVTALCTTPYSVYQITEVRSLETDQLIGDLEVTECVDGTYKSNVVGLSLVGDQLESMQLFTVTDNGLIKGENLTKYWSTVGKAFEDGQTDQIGTDIATKQIGEDLYILASSKDEHGSGTIMYTEDGGLNWEKATFENDVTPVINAVDFDLTTFEGYYAYAAGFDTKAWYSSDNGGSWLESDGFENTSLNDVFSDPLPSREGYAYLAGSLGAEVGIRVAMTENYGVDWTPIEEDLGGTAVNQLAKCAGGGNAGQDQRQGLYAATNYGVYKANLCKPPDDPEDPNGPYDPGDITWNHKTYGIGTPNLGSIIVDPNNSFGVLAATAPSEEEPHIWASGDSGRSWIGLPLGDIPSDCHINKLAACRNGKGYVVGTDKGVFYIKEIFQCGQSFTDYTWGPGTIIINGDAFTEVPNNPLTIIGPCTVYFTYGLNLTHSGSPDANKPMLYATNSPIDVEGTAEDPVVFTSCRPTDKTAGDWEGLGKVGSTNADISLNHCNIEYAANGINITTGSTSEIDIGNSSISNCSDYGVYIGAHATLSVNHCHFEKMNSAGIYMSTYPTSATISNSRIEDCGNYGIYCSGGEFTASTDTLFDNKYGILYEGDDGPTISYCRIFAPSSSVTSYYGIYVRGGIYGSNVQILGDYIAGFGQGGIYLENVTSHGLVSYTSVYEGSMYSSIYGIYCNNSSVSILGDPDADEKKNVIQGNDYGIWLASTSDPKIRRTKFIDNIYKGIHIAQGCSPDLGSFNDHGNNSFILNNPGQNTYHVYNANNNFSINALYNYWNPLSSWLFHNVTYNPYLSNDPLPRIAPPSWQTANLPEDLFLARAYPNPFNPTTMISFNLISSQEVSVRIYNIMGQRIRDLYYGYEEAGVISLVWDGKDMNGRPV
ncbi:MAG TPA: hypothetical protein DEO84_00535, partial [candidate division Zixibacteria bacterium]|nr:hypothetical protein [candidate division Zixibacteria bacterium]